MTSFIIAENNSWFISASFPQMKLKNGFFCIYYLISSGQFSINLSRKMLMLQLFVSYHQWRGDKIIGAGAHWRVFSDPFLYNIGLIDRIPYSYIFRYVRFI